MPLEEFKCTVCAGIRLRDSGTDLLTSSLLFAETVLEIFNATSGMQALSPALSSSFYHFRPHFGAHEDQSIPDQRRSCQKHKKWGVWRNLIHLPRPYAQR